MLVIGALAGDAVLAARQAARSLEAARSYLEQAADRLVEGRLEAAAASFAQAREAGGDATGALRRPGAFLVGSLPRLGDDVRAVRALGQASVLLSEAGEHVVEAAGAVGWDGDRLPGIRPGGVVELDLLGRAEPGLRAAAERFRQASVVLDSVPPEGLHPRIADALDQARGALREQAQVVIAGAELTRLLPSFLGAEAPRRYFLAIQNLSAPRGSGGFLGHYGILEANNGQISLGRLAPVQTLGRVPPVSASPDVEARYARLGGVTHFIAANYSPDFPTSARVLLEMWERKTGEPLDGVIAVDSVWMSYVLGAIGPVRTPAWPEPLTAENINRIVNRDTFLLPQPLSNQAQGAIGAALWKAVLQEPPPTRGFGAAMARSLRERHLQIYVPNPEEQDALRRLGAGGELRLGRFPLLVVWQDAVNNRAGYFAEKRVTHRITLEADGSAEVLTEVTLENTAPDHPPSILLGDGKSGDPVGYFAAFVNVYLPEGATGMLTEVTGGPTLGLVEEEFGHGVVTELLGAPAGGTATLKVTYRVAEAATGEGERGLFLQVIPQPALRPDLVTVDVRTPLAAEILSVRGLDTSGISARYVGHPQVPVPLAIRFALSGG
ncbi:MAG TPA: DUF4012 domain-containing protein [Candidatus Methylomirabilis sp.]|nr:DUF4012 domain-containing protein [Candidatus Methylomirabilis sp.]